MKINVEERLDKKIEKLEAIEQRFKDLNSIVKWAEENKVGLGEIVELLPEYNYFKKVVNKRFDDDFGAFVKFIDNNIVEMEEN